MSFPLLQVLVLLVNRDDRSLRSLVSLVLRHSSSVSAHKSLVFSNAFGRVGDRTWNPTDRTPCFGS